MANKWQYRTTEAWPPAAGLPWCLIDPGDGTTQTLGDEALTTDFGAQGWELVGIVPGDKGGSLLIFKRPTPAPRGGLRSTTVT